MTSSYDGLTCACYLSRSGGCAHRGRADSGDHITYHRADWSWGGKGQTLGILILWLGSPAPTCTRPKALLGAWTLQEQAESKLNSRRQVCEPGKRFRDEGRDVERQPWPKEEGTKKPLEKVGYYKDT